MLVDDVPFLDIDSPQFMPESDEVAKAREQHWWARTSRAPYVLRHAEARQLLQDRRLVHGAQKAMVMMGVTSGPTFDWWNGAIMSLEGVEHARIRGLVQKAFTAAGVESLRDFTRATAERLAGDIDPAGCEFEAAFGEPLPTVVMCELLGVPAADYDAFHGYANDIGLAFSREISAEQLPRIDAAITGLSDYVAGLIADRRRNLGDDLLSSLITVEEQGERLSTDELHNLTLILVWSGQDTTARQLGRAMVVFAEHPDQWRQLAERPELVDQAVEEVCRWSPQTRMLWRFASEDLAYEDLDVPANSMVFLGVVAANRDPRAWGDGADRFDITVARRTINLDFSAGIHLCLGANLARLEMTEGLRALTRRFGPPEIAGDVVWRPPSAAIHGPDALPLRFTPPA